MVIELVDYRCLALIGLLLSSIGCNRDLPNTIPNETVSFSKKFDDLIAQNEWEDAWEISNEVLIESGQDSATLQLVAQVAFKTGRVSRSADLLTEASRLDQYQDIALVNHAFTALLACGRLFDGLALLERAVATEPASSEPIRLLHDLLIATEQHRLARKYRDSLIRRRAIDIDLLFLAFEQIYRTQEIASLATLHQRNPSDARPMIGEARQMYDQQDYESAVSHLQPIVKQHSEFLPAQTLLGRSILLLSDQAKLLDWTQQLPDQIISEPEFWLTIGDWATRENKLEIAKIAYGNASKRGLGCSEAWTKLAATFDPQSDDSAVIAAVQHRATELSKLRELYAKFASEGKQSIEVLLEISETLFELGEVWEAEAWSAVGFTFPSVTDQDRRNLSNCRNKIVAAMSPDSMRADFANGPDWDWLATPTISKLISELSGEAATEKKMANQSIMAESTPGWIGKIISLSLENQAHDRGLTFSGHTANDLDQPGILLSKVSGCGGGTLDYDRDGWPDLYLAAAGGTPPNRDSSPNATFRNLNGQFQRIPSLYDADDRGFTQGVAVGDVNEDGFDDLLALNYGKNSLWINNGDGSFSDQSARWLPGKNTWSTSAAIADIDGDGISDIFVTNYCRGLAPTIEECQSSTATTPISCSPTHFPAETDLVLKGLEDGRFVDVTNSSNAIPTVLGRGLGIVAGALDPTPGIDLFVSNDMSANHLWSQTTDPSVEPSISLDETGALRGLAADSRSRFQGSMGIAVADINFDHRPDFYVTNFKDEYNSLHVSNLSTGWIDRTSQEDLVTRSIPLVGFGTQAVDFDNNGESELIVTNGHVDHIKDRDGKVFYEQPAMVLQRNANGRFLSVGDRIKSDYFRLNHVGRALWKTDFNRDGKVDICMTHQTEPVSLIINNTPTEYSFLSLELVASTASRNAVGSVITVHQNGNDTTSFLCSGDGYFCSNQRQIHFGLGTQTAPVDLTVTWPTGRSQTWSNLETNREWLLVEGDEAFELTLNKK